MTTPLLHVGYLQFEIVGGGISRNLEQVKSELASMKPAPGSLIVLPEMWATGFVYEQLADLCKEMPAVLEELEELAAVYGVVLAGSLPEKKKTGGERQLFNTLFFSGLGEPAAQGISKQHLFSFWKEDVWFHPGGRPVPVRIHGSALIGGLVCYDLRFPQAAQLQCNQGADLLIVSAQWPSARIEQWKILLQARAIENQVFVVAANACGRWEGLQMGGHSMVIAPDGEILAEAGGENDTALVSLNWEVQEELRERFNTVAPAPWSGEDSDKVVLLDALSVIIANRKRVGQKIVFTNGCFDILHAGHVDYLQKARRQGDFLIVGLNNDQSIRSIKGDGRPINEEGKRARVLAALGCVDAVVLFGEDTPLNLINTLAPNVLVKGADWEEHEIVGAAEVTASGGRVERITFTSQTSTTGIIDQIKSTD